MEEELCSEVISRGTLRDYFVFAGIVVHELAHYAGCLLTGTRVERVVLLDKRGGTVLPHRPAPPFESWFIALMPFFIGNLLAFFLFADAVRAFASANYAYLVVALWLGASIALFAHPSRQDLNIAWRNFGQMFTGPITHLLFVILLFPAVLLTLLLMEFKDRFLESRAGRLVWMVALFGLAQVYVMS